MNINLTLFLSSSKELNGEGQLIMKTFHSTFRPAIGDILDDPGFDSRFHNGYEVVKVTVNYEREECHVSLSPLAIDIEEISLQDYLDKLLENGWRVVSKEELKMS